MLNKEQIDQLKSDETIIEIPSGVFCLEWDDIGSNEEDPIWDEANFVDLGTSVANGVVQIDFSPTEMWGTENKTPIRFHVTGVKLQYWKSKVEASEDTHYVRTSRIKVDEGDAMVLSCEGGYKIYYFEIDNQHFVSEICPSNLSEILE